MRYNYLRYGAKLVVVIIYEEVRLQMEIYVIISNKNDFTFFSTQSLFCFSIEMFL